MSRRKGTRIKYLWFELTMKFWEDLRESSLPNSGAQEKLETRLDIGLYQMEDLEPLENFEQGIT